MAVVVLQPGRDRSVRRGHPWILSGAVARVDGPAEPGALVRVLSAEGEPVGFGHLSPGSALRVRMLTLGKEEPGEDLLAQRIHAAVRRRDGDPLVGDTDAVRLVNSEGDLLPGLVVDRYADTVVAKFTTAGMVARREEVASALREWTGAGSGFERGDPVAGRREGFRAESGSLWGEAPAGPIEIRERERRYSVDVVSGQKTGFYLDQRDARDLVESLARGARVLDLFAYTGGFSVAAARGGATVLTLVESSAGALDLARANLTANGVTANGAGAQLHLEREDAFRFVRRDEANYDLIVVDPPPLARHRRDVARASRAYKDLALHALRRAAPGGRLLLFACSHHVGPDLFRKIVFGAALDAGRSPQVLRSLGQTVDHPVSIYHPEGAYLNGLLLRT